MLWMRMGNLSLHCIGEVGVEGGCEGEIHSTVAKAGWERQLQAHAAAADVASD